jgi:hypothetical protein
MNFMLLLLKYDNKFLKAFILRYNYLIYNLDSSSFLGPTYPNKCAAILRI